MEGCLIGATKMHEGFMWRSTGNMTKKCTSYTWKVTRNSNLNFIKITHPHPGVVLWIRIGGVKMHVSKCTSQPPERSMLALLSVPSWSGKGAH